MESTIKVILDLNSFSLIVIYLLFLIVNLYKRLQYKFLASSGDGESTEDKKRKSVVFYVQFITDLISFTTFIGYIAPLCYDITAGNMHGIEDYKITYVYASAICVLSSYVLELIYCLKVNPVVWIHHSIVLFLFFVYNLIIVYVSLSPWQLLYVTLTCLLLSLHASLDFSMHYVMSYHHHYNVLSNHFAKHLTTTDNYRESIKLYSATSKWNYKKYVFLYNAVIVMIFRIITNMVLIYVNYTFQKQFNVLDNLYLQYWMAIHLICAVVLMIVQFETSRIHYKLYIIKKTKHVTQSP